MAEILDTYDANAKASDIVEGKTAYVKKGKVTGTIGPQNGGVYTPTTSTQTVAQRGKYLTSDIVIVGDENLRPENISKGVKIFGVVGTFNGEPPPPTLPEGFFDIKKKSEPEDAKLKHDSGVAGRGMTVTIDAEMDENYESYYPNRYDFFEWRENGETLTEDETYKFQVDRDREFTALFSGPNFPVNGMSWKKTGIIPDAGNFGNIAYSNGKFVAVAKYGYITALSQDGGKTWESNRLPYGGKLRVRAKDGTLFAISFMAGARYAYYGGGAIWNEVDGWGTPSSSSTSYSPGYIYDMTVGSNPAVTVINGTETAGKSDAYPGHNATSWSLDYSFPSGTNWYLYDDGSLFTSFIAVRSTGNSASMSRRASSASSEFIISTLPFSASWTNAKMINGIAFIISNTEKRFIYAKSAGVYNVVTLLFKVNDIAYGDGIYVAVSEEDNQAAYSEDLENWTHFKLPSDGFHHSIAYGDGKFLIISSSTDVISYRKNIGASKYATNVMPATFQVHSIAYGKNAFIATSVVSKYYAYSNDGINWKRYSLPKEENWGESAYGNGIFIITPNGAYDGLIISKNGIDWEFVKNDTMSIYLSKITFLNGKFFAGQSSYSTYYLSEDGVNWEEHQITTGVSVSKIVYGNGQYVGISTTNKIFRSTDGIAWEQTSTPVIFADIAYGNGRFISLYANRSTFYYSTDGITWEMSEFPASIVVSNIFYCGDRFIGTISGSRSMLYSEDGILWGIAKFPFAAGWNGVAYGNNTYVAIARSAQFAYCTESELKEDYTVQLSANPSAGGSVSGGGTFKRGSFITVNAEKAEGYDFIDWKENGKSVRSMPQYTFTVDKNRSLVANFKKLYIPGIDWWVTKAPLNAYFTSVAYGGDKFVAISDGTATGNGSNWIAYSADSVKWEAASRMPIITYWSEISYGNGVFVAVSKSNAVAYSADGLNWKKSTIPTPYNWNHVTYGKDKFVALAYGQARAAYSYDGVNWTEVDLPHASTWAGIVYGGDRFIAVGLSDNTAIYSTNGLTWSTMQLPSSGVWSDIAYGNGTFVIIEGNSSKALYSTNGTSWNVADMPEYAYWKSIAFGDGRFVAIQSSGSHVAYSEDGVTWKLSTMNYGASWDDIAYGNGAFVVVGATDNIPYSRREGPENG